MGSQGLNQYQQPVGPSVSKEMAMDIPQTPLEGRYCRIVVTDPQAHASGLFEQLSQAPDDRDWTYMVDGPFARFDDYQAFLERMATTPGQTCYTIMEADSGMAVGNAALMRQDAANGVIEIGNIMYSRRLQHTVAGSEAIFLLMQRALETMNYRRLEWKCDSLNEPSQRAARRYGFQFEGVFRQAVLYKGRNRDTSWYSIIDTEWPAISRGFRRWLSDDNFDANGKQRARLGALIAQSRQATQ
ncbi:MAG TPA: GNAT family protein [Burkholderiaceae bacterium]|nr:GNAT family protein [Burkholderiaceae bacterium]